MAVFCYWVPPPSGRLKNLKDADKWSSLSLFLSGRGRLVTFTAWAALMQSDGLNGALSPVRHADIALSINIYSTISSAIVLCGNCILSSISVAVVVPCNYILYHYLS